MRKQIIIFLTLLFSLPLIAQQVSIEVTVKGMQTGRVYLSKINGDAHSKIDSLLVSGEIFRFNLKDTVSGVYRITLGQTRRSSFHEDAPQNFDLIVSSEPRIIVKTSLYSLVDSMQVIESNENKIYYEYLRLTAKYKHVGGALLPLYSLYKPEDHFFAHLNAEFARMQKEYNESLVALASKAPGSFASAIIKMNYVPFIDPSGGFNAMNAFLKDHFFDLVLFNDPRLIHSQVYTQKILEYLSFYSDPDLSQAEQEELFIEAVDRIMERASYNEQVFDFILGYLVDGFDQFKMENVLVHLAIQYVEKGCETDSKKIMEQRLDAFKRMAIGNTVNDIVQLDMYGSTHRLFDLKNEYVLVVFWSTWCPHCTKLLPELKEWYQKNEDTDIGIYAVSIDTSRHEWEAHLLMNPYPWVNVCNFQGWEGKAMADYNVYASPTLFLLDRNRRIIAKPTTFREFRREMEKLAIK